ncbi:MAG: ComEC/Rec2 family competence protein [Candidatus Dojkabacteria bacterium]
MLNETCLNNYFRSKFNQFSLFKYNFERLKIFQLALGFIIGVILISSQSIFLVFPLLLLAFPLRKRKFLFYVSCVFGILFFSSWNNTINNEVNSYTGKKNIEETAQVLSVEENGFQKNILLKLDNLQGEALAQVTIYSEIKTYDYVLIRGNLSLPYSFEDFDYPAYLRSNKIFYIFKGSVVPTGKNDGLLSKIADVKQYLLDTSQKNINTPYSAIFNGILLGDTSQIPDEINNIFRNTGTSHILSVSGFNFTIILIFLLMFSPWIGRKRILIISIPILIGFLFLVGIENITAMRATIMILVYIFANLAGRKLNYLYLVSLTLALFLLEYPLSWTNLSLQLSFGSLLGLYFLSDKLKSFFKKLKLAEAVNEPLSAALAAILGTMPFTLNTFGYISMVAPVVNILVLPFVPLIMLLGFLGEISRIFQIETITRLIFMNVEFLLKLMTKIIEWFAGIPFAISSNPFIIFIMICLLLGLILFTDFKSFYKKYY